MDPVQVIFCADRRVLPGLHVAAASVLLHRSSARAGTDIHVISDDLSDADMGLLDATLRGIGRRYSLSRLCVDPAVFSGFPSMRGSWGAYYRLFICSLLDRPRSVYIDVDTVCMADVADLAAVDLSGRPAGFVSEGSFATNADASIRALLPANPSMPYLNSGVMVADHAAWRSQQVTERCMDVLRKSPVDRWDQTALNYVLADNWFALEPRFNYATNIRSHWPTLADPERVRGHIVHFLDYPKPWDLLAEIVHPHAWLWNDMLARTEMRSFRSWHRSPCRRRPRSGREWSGYYRTFKSRLLHDAWRSGWMSSVKGMHHAGRN